MEEAEAIDLILGELAITAHLSLSIRKILNKKGITLTDNQITSIERVLMSKSLVSVVDTNSDGFASYTLSETGDDFLKVYRSYSNYLEGFEVEKRSSKQRRRHRNKSTIKTASSAEPAELIEPEKADIEAVDLVLKELKNTSKPSLNLRRVLKKSKVDYSDDLITIIESILTSKSLVDKMGVDAEGSNSYSLAETGHDFIKTFGTYSRFLKGAAKEDRKTKKAKSKVPYKTSRPDSGEPIAAYVPPERNIGFFIFRIVLLFLLIVFFILVYLLT